MIMCICGVSLKQSFIAAGCLAVVLTGPRVFGQKAGDAAKGKDVFEANCSVCHNADSEEKKMGPGLKGLFKHDKMANGKKPTEANVRSLINAGGGGMPSFSDMLSDDEKNDVIAYLKTL